MLQRKSEHSGGVRRLKMGAVVPLLHPWSGEPAKGRPSGDEQEVRRQRIRTTAPPAEVEER
jgi:hypothetical protein